MHFTPIFVVASQNILDNSYRHQITYANEVWGIYGHIKFDFDVLIGKKKIQNTSSTHHSLHTHTQKKTKNV